MLDWKETLIERAKKQGMCRENFTALERLSDRRSAVALYKKTVDWALENGYPGLDVIREYFSGMEQDGIYVDRDFRYDNVVSQVAVFHNCSGTIRAGLNMETMVIPMLYLANGSRLVIDGNGSTDWAVTVPVYVCDGCEAVQGKGVKLRIYRIKTL